MKNQITFTDQEVILTIESLEYFLEESELANEDIEVRKKVLQLVEKMLKL